ncbi:hypothetical protein FSP39_016171 [Pinctada imbricata]|uniref:Fucosyltransferase n=1 Tax=Pinctada imbricata TaxID=66713 RepID=A0AA88YE17_PINIB|nr:hypothetical protein FSP39_016171 [Pinctada imbricata]
MLILDCDMLVEERIVLDSQTEYIGQCRNQTSDNRCNVILFHGIKWWESSIIEKYDPFNNCPVQCDIITDVSKSATADVVIMQADTVTNESLPTKQANQIWVLSEYESPNNMKDANRPLVLKDVLDQYKRKFNWTMGYRRDADFVITHGRFVLRDTMDDNYSSRLDRLMETKKKTSTWFNSHCKTLSLRETYGDMLQNHTQLDIFGTCGKVLEDCSPEDLCNVLIQVLKEELGVDFTSESEEAWLVAMTTVCDVVASEMENMDNSS